MCVCIYITAICTNYIGLRVDAGLNPAQTEAESAVVRSEQGFVPLSKRKINEFFTKKIWMALPCANFVLEFADEHVSFLKT